MVETKAEIAPALADLLNESEYHKRRFDKDIAAVIGRWKDMAELWYRPDPKGHWD